jgi:hypothetical protein
MKYIELIRCCAITSIMGVILLAVPGYGEIPPNYPAKPFQDSIQQIPGRFFVWRYDQAEARGISWQTPRTVAMTGDYYQYDGRKTAGVEDYIINRILNPAWDVYGNSKKQYPANPADTKANPVADTTLIYNDMNATRNGIYIGYIEHGEWLKSTVNVAQDGLYQIDLMLTANTNSPSIMISALNGTDSVSTGKINFDNTGFYHYYQFEKNVATIQLKKGLQVIRTDVTGEPPFNLWFYKFSLATNTSVPNELQKQFGDFRTTSLDDGSVQLNFTAQTDTPITVDLFDTVGRKLGSETLKMVQPGANTFRLSTRPEEGMVIVRLKQGNESFVSKVFVNANKR